MDLITDRGRGGTLRRLTRWVLVLLLASLWMDAPNVFGQGQSGPQKMFPSPEAAAKALGAAYKKGDPRAVAEILGDKAWRLVFSGDPVIDRHERAWFLSLYEEGHKVVADGGRSAVLQLGKDGQPYPIPVIKKGRLWQFDPSEGHEDLLSRRISKAELTAVNLVVAYVDAQREYHQRDHS